MESQALLEAFLRDLSLRGRSPHTISNYRVVLQQFLRAVPKPIDQITTKDIKHWLLTERQPKNKATSVAHDVVVLRSFFRWLVTEEWLDKDPAQRIAVPRMEQRLPKYLTHEEIERMREACRRPRDRAILEVLYSTGCRVSELCAINRRDVDWHMQEIKVFGKGSKERIVQFSTLAAIWLKRYLETRRDDHEALFLSNLRRRISKASVERIVRKLAERAGIQERVWPHRLRHSFASHLVQADVPIQVVQEALGHADISTTQVYAQITLNRRREHYRRVFA